MEEAFGDGTSDAQGGSEGGEGGQDQKGSCRGLFEFEAEDVSVQQVRWGLTPPGELAP